MDRDPTGAFTDDRREPSKPETSREETIEVGPDRDVMSPSEDLPVGPGQGFETEELPKDGDGTGKETGGPGPLPRDE